MPPSNVRMERPLEDNWSVWDFTTARKSFNISSLRELINDAILVYNRITFRIITPFALLYSTSIQSTLVTFLRENRKRRGSCGHLISTIQISVSQPSNPLINLSNLGRIWSASIVLIDWSTDGLGENLQFLRFAMNGSVNNLPPPKKNHSKCFVDSSVSFHSICVAFLPVNAYNNLTPRQVNDPYTNKDTSPSRSIIFYYTFVLYILVVRILRRATISMYPIKPFRDTILIFRFFVLRFSFFLTIPFSK